MEFQNFAMQSYNKKKEKQLHYFDTPHSVCFVEGLHDQAHYPWSHKVQRWLQLPSTALNIEDEICISTVIDNAKTLYQQTLHHAGNNVGRYRQMLQ